MSEWVGWWVGWALGGSAGELFLKKTIIEFAINVVEGKENLRESREGGKGTYKTVSEKTQIVSSAGAGSTCCNPSSPNINPCKRIAASSSLSSSSYFLKKVCSSCGEEELRAESPQQQQQQQLLYIIVYFVNVRCSSSCCTVDPELQRL